MRIVLATGNRDTVAELEPLLPGAEVSAAPEGFDPAETGTTLLQNAWIKAEALRAAGADENALALADDTGLIVHALGGRPGVFSSRYAGPDADARLAAVAQVAAELGVTANQVVLAWLLRASPTVIPLVGPRTLAQYETAHAALDVVLSDEQAARLDAAGA